MKKIAILLGLFLVLQNAVLAVQDADVQPVLKMSELKVFSEKGKFGLKDKSENIIVKPEYKKLIRVGRTSWLVQKGAKYGLMDCTGNYLVEPKYRNVERLFGKFVKLGNNNNYGLYNEYGKAIIPPEYSQISPLYGKMFLTKKNYKYGIIDFDGKVLLDNIFDDIYMPDFKSMRICYQGEWYEITELSPNEVELPENVKKVIINDKALKVTHLVTKSGVISGYSAITAADYSLKLVSSISPAYEETMDELMYSQGLDGLAALLKMNWLAKFPVVYAQKYYNNLRNPNNGPLYGIKSSFKRNIK